MISDARRGHVSPGIYTEERDVTYSVKSLGITSLGLVGETLYGPAFENIEIKDWTEFVDYFGGTSPEKFKGTGLPKYGLPYIAKSYLEESRRLNVVRVLGLSGYQAGPCWVLKNNRNKVVVVLRSKMEYKKGNNFCEASNNDVPTPIVTSIKKGPYTPKIYDSSCISTTGTGYELKTKGKFSITVNCSTENTAGYDAQYKYNVSLDPRDSDYIYRVLSSSPDTGNTPVYIEAVYENSFKDNDVLGNDFTALGTGTEMAHQETTYRYYACKYVAENTVQITKDLGYLLTYECAGCVTDIDGLQTLPNIGEKITNDDITSNTKILRITSLTGKTYVLGEYNNYCEMYRPAQTPWFVSEAYASDEGGQIKASLKKLFKFLTISDGNASNYQVKVSIQKIDPFKGTFDVVVRDFYDNDSSPVILEKFSSCSLKVGDNSYLGYKIGTSDGAYEAKSKYITVVFASDDDMSESVPCGFLGYPTPSYGVTNPIDMSYYTTFDPSVRSRKQYFGLNTDLMDTDILKYKGVDCYDDDGDINPNKLTNGFHMDSVLSRNNVDVYVDGASGYNFDSVSSIAVTADKYAPRIIRADYINHTIYKDMNLRKFTTFFYGGFDGWDVNRDSRTNTDEYKATNYTVINKDNVESSIFTNVTNNGLNANLNLPSTAITSDYYAYLAGYRVFSNPQDVDINLFATPGIDWLNNRLLVGDALDVIEDPEDGRGGDALYIIDSPTGLTPNELAYEFIESDIDSSYACTYYPWVMFFDSFNNQYLNLPPTKDVVRNIAKTDNNAYPWFAPAGFERGNVKCIKADFKTTLAQEDTLYENRINPIKTFGKDGVKIWGNKTTYSAESPLNRINVRRLMIRVKKLVSEAARHLIFEQYSDTLENQFRGLVEPILAEVKSNRGITDYRVMTEVTPETRDQHILPAKILIKPTPALEYISISFVVYPESVAFED